jgi:hypothetical protein
LHLCFYSGKLEQISVKCNTKTVLGLGFSGLFRRPKTKDPRPIFCLSIIYLKLALNHLFPAKAQRRKGFKKTIDKIPVLIRVPPRLSAAKNNSARAPIYFEPRA